MAFPIQWGKPSPRTNRLRFVVCPPDRWVILLDSPEEFHTIKLHWLADAGESGICPGDSCPLLGMTRHFESCYAPCMVFNEKEATWTKAILGIGDPGHTLANSDYKGDIIQVGKSRVKDEKRLIFLKRATRIEVPPPKFLTSFDVRPHLLRRWGLFSEAELLGCELHSPPQQEAANQQERAG